MFGNLLFKTNKYDLARLQRNMWGSSIIEFIWYITRSWIGEFKSRLDCNLMRLQPTKTKILRFFLQIFRNLQIPQLWSKSYQICIYFVQTNSQRVARCAKEILVPSKFIKGVVCTPPQNRSTSSSYIESLLYFYFHLL